MAPQFGQPDPTQVMDQAAAQAPTQNPLGTQPNPTQAAPQAMPAPAPPSPQQVAASQDAAHHYSIGKMVKSLFGSERSYQVNPQTGKTEAVDQPMSGGQIFRNMVAGVLLGGAAGRNEKSGFKGAVAGGEAEVREKQREDQQKQESARKDYQQNLEGRREDREETLSKAHMALLNAQTLRENQLMQREDFDWHERKAHEGDAEISALESLPGVRRVYRDISESEMNDLLKKNPNASHLMWRPTGQKIIMHPDGSFGHEETYSAIQAPKDTRIKIPEAQRVQWKKDGIEQFWGEIPKDATVDLNQYVAMSRQALQLRNDKDALSKQDLDTRKDNAAINLSEAQAAHFQAEASRIRKEGKDKVIAEKLYLEAADELDKLQKAGKGFQDLPTRFQDALADHSQAEAKDKGDMLKTMMSTGMGGTREAQDLYNEWRTLTTVHSRTQTQPPPPGGPGTASAGKIDNVRRAMKNRGIQEGTPESYQHIESRDDLTEQEKITMVQQTKSPIPWANIQTVATKNDVTDMEAATEMKRQGYTVRLPELAVGQYAKERSIPMAQARDDLRKQGFELETQPQFWSKPGQYPVR